MYAETIIQPSRIENATRPPLTSEAVSSFAGHRDAPLGQNARFFLDVTAVTGTTPSMTMNVYGVINNKSYFLGAFAPVTAIGAYTLQLNNVPDLLTVAPSPLSGTAPTFTCEVRCVR
jgi:hypothetical protein